jgi:RHS repeat-associated protein
LPAGGVTTEYVYDLGGAVVAEFVGTTWTKGYVYMGGLLAQYSNGTTYFVHKDHLGSTRALSNVSGGLHESYDFLPYGEPVGTQGTTTVKKFTGKERDAESGLDHAWFRKYNPALGCWISPDPVPGAPNNPQTLNRYAYVGANPLSYVDPFGLKEKCAFNVGIVFSHPLFTGARSQQIVKTEITRIFSTAKVGIQFVELGKKADYNLVVGDTAALWPPATQGGVELGATASMEGPDGRLVTLNRGAVFAERVYAAAWGITASRRNMSLAIGRVGAHEIAHHVGQLPDQPPQFSLNAMTSPADLGYLFSPNAAGAFWFTPPQAGLLQLRCKKLRDGFPPVKALNLFRHFFSVLSFVGRSTDVPDGYFRFVTSRILPPE